MKNWCQFVSYNKKTETGKIPGINKVFERQVCRVQVAHLHKAARASPSFKLYPSVLLLIIKKQLITSPIKQLTKGCLSIELRSIENNANALTKAVSSLSASRTMLFTIKEKYCYDLGEKCFLFWLLTSVILIVHWIVRFNNNSNEQWTKHKKKKIEKISRYIQVIFRANWMKNISRQSDQRKFWYAVSRQKIIVSKKMHSDHLLLFCNRKLKKMFSFLSSKDDECRNIIFKKPIANKAMKNHVIRSAEVPSEGSCRLMCYMEPNCESINLGPLVGGKHKCELNNATDEKQFANYLVNKPAFTYLAIEVLPYKRLPINYSQW